MAKLPSLKLNLSVPQNWWRGVQNLANWNKKPHVDDTGKRRKSECKNLCLGNFLGPIRRVAACDGYVEDN